MLFRGRRHSAGRGRFQIAVTEGPASSPGKPRPALWLVVFTGPALRTSLLGGLLVAEEAIGSAFDLKAGALAILVECSIFGGLLAVLLLPSLIRVFGTWAISLGSTVATIGLLAIGMYAAPAHSAGGVFESVALFSAATLLGFLVSVLSPVTQTLLNEATTDDAQSRHSLQSVWSAGLPAGFIAASVVGGVLVDWVGWWSALAVPLALAVLSALSFLDRGIVPPDNPASAEPDPPANEIATIVLALVAFEVWSTWGTLNSWIAPEVLLTLAATVAISAYAIGMLRHSPQPAISLEPFAISGFAAATLILLIYQFPTTAEFEVLLLTELDHMSAELIGDRTAIGNAGQVAGTIIAAGLLYKKQVGLALVASFALTIIGLASYTLYPWVDGFIYTAATRTITGLGGGLLTPVLFVLALDHMPPPLQLAAGTWLVLANIGGVEIGLALFDMVLEISTTLSGSTEVAYFTVEIAQLAVGVITALLVAGLVAKGRLHTRIGAGASGG